MLHTPLGLCLWTLLGVFGDEVKSVSVMEGQNVTLHTDLTHIQSHHMIVWRFGENGPAIASIHRSPNNPTYNNDKTEIFRDRLKMNDQTGDLTITHITSQHSGLYHLQILTSSERTTKSFNLTVKTHTTVSVSTPTSSSSSSLSQSLSMSDADLHTPSGKNIFYYIIPLSCAVAAGSVMFVIALLRKRRKTCEEDQPCDDDITYVDTTFHRRKKQRQSFKEEEDDVVYSHVNTRH